MQTELNKTYYATGNSSNKAVGESISKRCKGTTAKGNRCKHPTKIANGYCYQQTKQNSNANSVKSTGTPLSIPTCGARTATGNFRNRRVKNGGRCYQHK